MKTSQHVYESYPLHMLRDLLFEKKMFFSESKLYWLLTEFVSCLSKQLNFWVKPETRETLEQIWTSIMWNQITILS